MRATKGRWELAHLAAVVELAKTVCGNADGETLNATTGCWVERWHGLAPDTG